MPGERAFNAHVVAIDGEHWKANLAVRAYLRAHPEEQAQYVAARQTALAAGHEMLLT